MNRILLFPDMRLAPRRNFAPAWGEMFQLKHLIRNRTVSAQAEPSAQRLTRDNVLSGPTTHLSDAGMRRSLRNLGSHKIGRFRSGATCVNTGAELLCLISRVAQPPPPLFRGLHDVPGCATSDRIALKIGVSCPQFCTIMLRKKPSSSS